jgi:adenosylcobinamide kinase/adenosylcobinamide-phosphate guanylyltransferase
MGRLELVTGGARSGKSTFAERRALELAAVRSAPVVYVATAVVTDEEMAARIARHRARRPDGWRTIEAPEDLATALEAGSRDGAVMLVDCLSVWAANRLVALGDPDTPDGPETAAWWRAVEALEGDLVAEVDDALAAALPRDCDLVLVTNEVGFGVVPATPLGRAYRDLLGRLNQRVAAGADAVHLVVAGLAVDLRRLAATTTADTTTTTTSVTSAAATAAAATPEAHLAG